ncbi:hypothetical protein [Streptomyces sp. NPDC008125]|uniref:hypothetical protein n=1 Tax=Streptomyces sp. NPDC008125 TaxID=3364811 RepID=UPI0036EE2D2B
MRLTDRRLVIVKPITDGGDTGADADTRFAREVAGLRLAGRASRPTVAPAVLATDLSSRVMVPEYLDDLGRTDDWMPGYAESLARLHALTGPADAGTRPAWSGPTATDVGSSHGIPHLLARHAGHRGAAGGGRERPDRTTWRGLTGERGLTEEDMPGTSPTRAWPG